MEKTNGYDRRIFPLMIHGNMAGMNAIIVAPVMKNEVIGVMTLRMIPQTVPAYRTVRMSAALMIGPVMYTLRFLKNWLTMQIASMIAVTVICFVYIFIAKPPFVFTKAIIRLLGVKCKFLFIHWLILFQKA